MLYRNYDAAGLDAQYRLRARHPDFQDYFDRWERESERVRKDLPHQFDVAYGKKPGQKLDVFPATNPNAPVFLFIHGGYWQLLDKKLHDFIAEPFIAAGCAVVVNNYTLAPDATMNEIVRQNRATVTWIYHHARSFNGDRSRIYVSGHSAGGHLTTMMMSTDWTTGWNLPADVIKGGCAISGLFDLEPIRLCYVNDAIKMDEEVARRNSPIYHLPKGNSPLIIAVGANETDEFIRQSADFATLLKEKDYPVEYLLLPDHHHFSIILDLGKADSTLTQAIFKQMGITHG
jgi:arylformamidase